MQRAVLRDDLTQSIIQRVHAELEHVRLQRIDDFNEIELLEQTADTRLNNIRDLMVPGNTGDQNMVLTRSQVWGLIDHSMRSYRDASTLLRYFNADPNVEPPPTQGVLAIRSHVDEADTALAPVEVEESEEDEDMEQDDNEDDERDPFDIGDLGQHQELSMKLLSEAVKYLPSTKNPPPS